MNPEKVQILKTAWKIYKSGKYKNTEELLCTNGGRSFIGILCVLLKDKLNLPWREYRGDIVIGKQQYCFWMPTEVKEYFGLKISEFECFRLNSKNAKNFYDYILKNGA
jgi:hypothetical protein